MAFKDRLKELRTNKGLTQDDLAHRLDIPSSTIRRYETDESSMPKHDRLEKIADFFGCTVDYLLERDASNVVKETKEHYGLSDIDKKVLEEFRKLDPKDQEYLVDLMKRIQKK